jgi:hypothetical protein
LIFTFGALLTERCLFDFVISKYNLLQKFKHFY